jgi:hypothetical protein
MMTWWLLYGGRALVPLTVLECPKFRGMMAGPGLIQLDGCTDLDICARFELSLNNFFLLLLQRALPLQERIKFFGGSALAQLVHHDDGAQLRNKVRSGAAQVRSDKVRFITRPKSRTMRATRQLLPPAAASDVTSLESSYARIT